MVPISRVLICIIQVIFDGVVLEVFQELTSFHHIDSTVDCIGHVGQKSTFRMVPGLKL
jgi:hypothetical protein